MKPFGRSRKGGKSASMRRSGPPGTSDTSAAADFFRRLRRGRNAGHDVPDEPGKRAWTGTADRRGLYGRTAGRYEQDSLGPDGSRLAVHMVCACADGEKGVYGRIQRNGELGGKPRRVGIRTLGADLITLASMLRIPVNMHNVSEENCSVPRHGTRSARRTGKARITGRAETTGRCISKNAREYNILSSVFINAL